MTRAPPRPYPARRAAPANRPPLPARLLPGEGGSWNWAPPGGRKWRSEWRRRFRRAPEVVGGGEGVLPAWPVLRPEMAGFVTSDGPDAGRGQPRARPPLSVTLGMERADPPRQAGGSPCTGAQLRQEARLCQALPTRDSMLVPTGTPASTPILTHLAKALAVTHTGPILSPCHLPRKPALQMCAIHVGVTPSVTLLTKTTEGDHRH